MPALRERAQRNNSLMMGLLRLIYTRKGGDPDRMPGTPAAAEQGEAEKKAECPRKAA